jgi:hypothetical protein
MNSLKVFTASVLRLTSISLLLLAVHMAHAQAGTGAVSESNPASSAAAASSAVNTPSDAATSVTESNASAQSLTVLPPSPTSAPSSREAAKSGTKPGTTKQDTRPTWPELSADQQRALLPLSRSWSNLSEGQKRKWLALSHNFRDLSPLEQDKLQERMMEWAHLSTQERALARLHFAEVSQLSNEERKAKWEAYQALSPEERQKLADNFATIPKGAAIATRPVPPKKLTQPPASKGEQVLQPRIDTEQINPVTLLPHFLQGASTR